MPTKTTPLIDCHLRAGAKMVEFAGWQMPVRYDSEIDEHHAVRQRAGLFDVSHMGEIRVHGADALAFLQRLTPNDVSKLRPGRAHYSALLTVDATYVDDLLIYQLADGDYLLVVNAANAADDLAWLEQHHDSEDCRIDDVSDDYALLALQGPDSVDLLSRLIDPDVDLAAIKYYRFLQDQEVAGVPCLLSRTGYTGELGFELYLPAEGAAKVWDALIDTGGVTAAGLGARDTLRLEAGMSLYGHEIDRTTTPYEANLGWTVKLGKGDFIGRDVLAAQKEDGVARRLVGFEMVERGIARQGYDVLASADDGAETLGQVCSGTYSPTLERAIGTAYVPVERATDGEEIVIAVRKRRLRARLVAMPFYQRS